MDPTEEEKEARLSWLRQEHSYRRSLGIQPSARLEDEIRAAEEALRAIEEDASGPAPIPLAAWAALAALILSIVAAWRLL